MLIHLRGILENAVEKLKDSNRQLQAAIDSGDRDAEFLQAIGVGIPVLNHHTQRVSTGSDA